METSDSSGAARDRMTMDHRMVGKSSRNTFLPGTPGQRKDLGVGSILEQLENAKSTQSMRYM
jgi:hypothetical protein